MTLNLGTIEQEAAACRKAWKNSKAEYAWHCHHGILAEQLTEPAENRIDYILAKKPKEEQALRLRLFRPATDAAWKTYDDALAAARKTYDAAIAAARKTYDAWKAYDDARDAAWKAYDDATSAAWRVYNDAIAAAHASECSDCPWDGETIFPESAS